MHNKITRRKFIKWMAIAGGAIIASSLLSVGGKVVLDKRRRAKRLVGITKEHPVESNRYFTLRESALVSALAAVIVPTDETGPGVSRIDIVDALGQVLETSHDRHILYRKGLIGFDEAAQHKYGQVFNKLTYEQQVHLLELIDGAIVKWKVGESLLTRLRRKAQFFYYQNKLGCAGETLRLFPILIEDVKQVFYTSQVAWDWLGYDGPPMPNGYLGQLSKCEQYW